MIDLDILAAPAFLIDVGDGGYRFNHINHARELATGRMRRDVVGRSPSEIFSNAVAAHLIRQFAACIGADRAIDFEEDFGGIAETRTWLTTLSPLRPEAGGAVTQLLGIGVDITDRKRSERDAELQAQRAEQDAKKAHSRLRDAIESLPEAIVFLDAEDRYVLWNRKYAELYADIADLLAPGVRFVDVLEASIRRGHMPEITDDAQAWMAKRLRRLRNPGAPEEEEYSDGRWMRHEERRTSDGGTIGVRIDITDLKAREQSFRLLFRDNPLPMYLYDFDSFTFVDVNEAAVSFYGYTCEQFLAMTVLDLWPKQDRAWIRAAIVEGFRSDQVSGPARHIKADGCMVDAEIYARKLNHKGRPTILAGVVDVTERLRAESQIAHLAHHDPLTALPNRTLFLQRLAEEFARPRPRAGLCSVTYLDLDDFKEINDRFGHGEGDSLLRQVAERLRGAVREEDVVARFGGDEFAIMQRDLHRPEDAGEIATRILQDLSRPFHVADREIVIGASLGIALFPDTAESSGEVVRQADTALYRAKDDGRRTFRFFEPGMDAMAKARRALAQEVRQAVEARAFHLEYQPLVNLETGRIACCEALSRWQHPQRGLVPPSEFIPLVEEIGLIVDVGDWVLAQACAEAATWPDDVKVAVNLSPVQFRKGAVIGSIKAALASSGLRPDRLEIEITESVLLADDEPNRLILTALRDLGVRIALDDFGTGYSSLAYLQSFPIDKIKIDRAFIRTLGADPRGDAIVRAIINLGRALQMTTTAEGVETVQQLDMLRDLGCDEAQGYLFGKPVPISINRSLLFAQSPLGVPARPPLPVRLRAAPSQQLMKVGP